MPRDNKRLEQRRSATRPCLLNHSVVQSVEEWL